MLALPAPLTIAPPAPLPAPPAAGPVPATFALPPPACAAGEPAVPFAPPLFTEPEFGSLLEPQPTAKSQTHAQAKHRFISILQNTRTEWERVKRSSNLGQVNDSQKQKSFAREARARAEGKLLSKAAFDVVKVDSRVLALSTFWRAQPRAGATDQARVLEIIGAIVDVQTIASGRGIRELRQLEKAYGKGHWRKKRGVARVRLVDGSVHTAGIHWYEAHGFGRKETKIERLYR
jgi:hypothetical protein